MRAFVLAVALLLSGGQGPQDSLRVLFWNLENFFDWRNDSTSVSDADFSSRGAKHWTRKRFYAKCNAAAKGILWAGGQMGGTPDVIGLAEVENAFVLRRLADATALSKLGYRVVHFDSPDRRGIDVGLLYRTERLRLVDKKPCAVWGPDSLRLPTRDILLARFIPVQGGEDVAVLVCHLPSKYGGAAASGPRRALAAARLRELADSLQNLGITCILAMGDMNDTPDSPLFRQLEPTLESMAQPLLQQGRGTLRYDGRWELIDHFYRGRSTSTGPMRIFLIPFLMVPDKKHGGLKPLRTYAGPRYLGGVSDHCPIGISLPW